jgi:hypothetical protein
MELSQVTIKKINSSREGAELKKFITCLTRSLDRVSDIPDNWSKEQKAIEVTARKRAATKLAEILKPFADYVEPQEKEEKESY